MPNAPRIRDRSRCYPLDCRVTHRTGKRHACTHAEGLLYIGWTRVLDFACSAQYWTFLPYTSARWLTDFLEQLDRCGLADEGDAGCSWTAAEATEHLGALTALGDDPPPELREVLDLWEGPLVGGEDLAALHAICSDHAACKATLTVRKWWHW